ncbi:hypothetical protein VaNZ11_005268 [Volvox africanus]|uniref:FAD-binding FR-type domain-containing protein n=1 Tax=Volvox africanus TaxID=51714 RepID=A0ABQ5RYA9_9CHLO|nr:hypothetical protein VaNZ11_005268 [Volvox africanus]
MNPNTQWLPGARRRFPSQRQDQDLNQNPSLFSEQALDWDAYEERHMFDTKRNRLAKNFLSSSTRNCGLFWYRMLTTWKWLPSGTAVVAGVVLTCGIWFSGDSSLAGLAWQWSGIMSPFAASNAILLSLAGLSYALFAPHLWPGNTSGRPLMPLGAKEVIYLFWVVLNLVWFIAGIRERDFRKPSWLKQTRVASRAQHFSEPVLHLLRLMYGLGMASAWPLLANLFVVLLPVDRSLFLLAGLGVGHEEGVLAHALSGSAVWVWAAAHAILTQAPMLAAGLWQLIMLPPLNGSETKATVNFMGLLAFLSLCGLGISSLARLRRRFFNSFQLLHLLLAPAVLLFGCLHDSKIFWYSMLGAILYGADLAQRWLLRRRAAVATATVYPLQPPAAPRGVGIGAGAVVGGGGSKFVVLQIQTSCAPECVAGQHVYIKVPAVSRWEWHPYSVAVQDDRSFSVVIKAGGDWERRLCRLVELEAAAGGASHSARLDVVYEGLYGTQDLQSAAASADRVLMFAGGAGITPIASVLHALLTAAQLSMPPQEPPADTAARGMLGYAPAQPYLVSPGESHNQQSGLISAAVNGVDSAQGPEHQTLLSAGITDTAVWAAPPAADGSHAPKAVLGSDARVHLVWAVTQQSDTQPLLPLLQAAAAHGWAVDIHCTRPPPDPSALVAVDCGVPEAKGDTATSSSAIMCAAAACDQGPVGIVGAPLSPWQLHGIACWSVAAVAALFGAMGLNLASTAASTHSCKVRGPIGTDHGVLNSTTKWVATVHKAFQQSLTAVTSVGADDSAGTSSAWSRLAAAVLQGNAAPVVFSCPLLAPPLGKGLHTAVVDGIRVAGDKALKAALKGASGEATSLRVCRTMGAAAPELCVKCDPFKGHESELQNAWPCCQARVCFFAARLAPLLGWVTGVMLGAALACLVWRRWSATRGKGLGRRRLLLTVREARRWILGDKVTKNEAAARLLTGDVGDGISTTPPSSKSSAAERSTAERAGPSAAAMSPGFGTRPKTDERSIGQGLMVTGGDGAALAAIVSADATQGVLAEQGGVAAKSEGGNSSHGIRVHLGRPDVEAYICAAAATGDATGRDYYGRAAYNDNVCGVVVCGPESMHSSVRAAFCQHLQKFYPDSWFRGFSFTT